MRRWAFEPVLGRLRDGLAPVTALRGPRQVGKSTLMLQVIQTLLAGGVALRIEEGRDSLAGRLSTLEMGPLHLREVAEWRGFGTLPAHLPLNGLAPLKEQGFWQELRRAGEDHAGVRREAFAALAERGGYPLQRVAGTVVGWMQVQDYLRFLDGTLLIRLIPPLEIRLKRRGGAAKLCLCDHALREVKFRRRITPDDTLGLRSFIGRSHYRAPFGLLVTLTDEPGSNDPQKGNTSPATNWRKGCETWTRK